MRFSQIRAFHFVATHQGFSAAAAALAVSQPVISEQVRQLEAEYEVLLFTRDRKRVQLTAAGERLVIQTTRLFEIYDQIGDTLSENRAALAGRLRILADSAHHLGDRIEAFRARHPGVQIHLKTGNTADIIAALRNYEAEIGVVGSTAPGPDMDVVDLGTAPIVGMVARAYPGLGADDGAPLALSLAEIAAHPVILRETGSKTRQMIEEAAARAKLLLRPAVEVEGRDAMREIVAAASGIGFVSEAEFGHDARLRKIHIKGADLAMGEALICLRQRRDMRSIRAFMGLGSV